MAKLHYPYVDFARTKELFDKFTQNFNTGRNLRDSLRQPHHELFYALVRLYLKTIKEHNDLFSQIPELRAIDPSEPPPLPANNVMLSNILHNSEDSVYRHLKRLLKAGVIVKKVNHGMNRNYELFINPVLLDFREFQQRFDIQYDYKEENASCGLSQNKQETFKNIIMPVKNVINASVDGTIETYFTGNTEQSSEKNESAGIISEGSRAQAEYSEKIRALDRKIREMKKSYAAWLLSMAMTLLWKGRSIFQGEYDNAMQYIENNYFEHCNTYADFDRAIANYGWRIKAAARNVERKGYARNWFVFPSHYFDLNNKNGFAGTLKWWLDRKEYDKLKETKKKRKRDVDKLAEQIRIYIKTPDLPTYMKCQTYVKANIPHLYTQFTASVLNSRNTYIYE